MKTPLFSIIAVTLSAGIAVAEMPRKPEVDTFGKLWRDSPFTTKPLPPAPDQPDSPMADWTLGGVSEVNGGYMVTLLHKKNAGESMIIRPEGVQKISADRIERGIIPGEAGTFKLDRVEYGKGGWKDISVHLTAGSRSGVVRFDEKNLTPKASAPAAGNRPGPAGQPNPQAPAPSGERKAHVRVPEPVKR